MGQYIEKYGDIDNIGVVSYPRFRYRFVRYVSIMSVTSEISVISRHFVILFNVN